MPPGDFLKELGEFGPPPWREFTPQERCAIAACAPEGATLDCEELLTHANYYWQRAAMPPPREQLRLLTGAAERLRAVMVGIHGTRQHKDELQGLLQILNRILEGCDSA